MASRTYELLCAGDQHSALCVEDDVERLSGAIGDGVAYGRRHGKGWRELED
jgi:hypothetical protein